MKPRLPRKLKKRTSPLVRKLVAEMYQTKLTLNRLNKASLQTARDMAKAFQYLGEEQ